MNHHFQIHECVATTRVCLHVTVKQWRAQIIFFCVRLKILSKQKFEHGINGKFLQQCLLITYNKVYKLMGHPLNLLSPHVRCKEFEST